MTDHLTYISNEQMFYEFWVPMQQDRATVSRGKDNWIES